MNILKIIQNRKTHTNLLYLDVVSNIDISDIMPFKDFRCESCGIHITTFQNEIVYCQSENKTCNEIIIENIIK